MRRVKKSLPAVPLKLRPGTDATFRLQQALCTDAAATGGVYLPRPGCSNLQLGRDGTLRPHAAGISPSPALCGQNFLVRLRHRFSDSLDREFTPIFTPCQDAFCIFIRQTGKSCRRIPQRPRRFLPRPSLFRAAAEPLTAPRDGAFPTPSVLRPFTRLTAVFPAGAVFPYRLLPEAEAGGLLSRRTVPFPRRSS